MLLFTYNDIFEQFNIISKNYEGQIYGYSDKSNFIYN